MGDENKNDAGNKASEAGKALSKLGASKGGKARAEKLAPEDRQAIAKEAGEARWDKGKSLTPEQLAALPKATHKGVIKIGELELECYVLEDERRILHQRGVLKALGMARGGSSHGGDRLGKFVEGKILKEFHKKDLSYGTRPFLFRTPRGPIANGFEATILPDICELVIDAKEAGKLQKQQLNIARQAMILYRGFARIGITALVDEATGYEKDKAKGDLKRLLDAYIRQGDLLPSDGRFPIDYYREIFRLYGWDFDEKSSRRPVIIKAITSRYIYKKLPPGVYEKIKELNPTVYKNGSRRHRHYQFLTDDVGDPHLKSQIVAITTLLAVSESWSEFKKLFDRRFSSASGTQTELKFPEETEPEELS